MAMAVLEKLPQHKSEMRREQILCAAKSCVQQAGFHGASMADIAQAANLSVGQIYRYYENKEAIIAAIVAQNLTESRERFAQMQSASGSIEEAMLKEIACAVECLSDPNYVALHTEIMAEAARNPRVAKIVRDADAEERSLMHDLMSRIRKPHWSDAAVGARSEAIFTLLSGIIVRAVYYPEADKAGLTRSIQAIVRELLN